MRGQPCSGQTALPDEMDGQRTGGLLFNEFKRHVRLSCCREFGVLNHWLGLTEYFCG